MPNLRFVDQAHYPSSTCGAKASNGTTEVVVLAAPGAKKRLRIMSLHVSSSDDAIQTVTFRNGISGATFYSLLVNGANASPSFFTRDIEFPRGGLVLSENASLNAALGEASITTLNIGASALIEEVVAPI
jgi:hypothetical protein